MAGSLGVLHQGAVMFQSLPATVKVAGAEVTAMGVTRGEEDFMKDSPKQNPMGGGKKTKPNQQTKPTKHGGKLKRHQYKATTFMNTIDFNSLHGGSQPAPF